MKRSSRSTNSKKSSSAADSLSIRDRTDLKMSKRRFDITTLHPDGQRVFHNLSKKYDEEYALRCIFVMRTAVELHRAWHMTLLTSKILQQVKDTFQLRMTWELGVVKVKFQFDDGGYELHRKVPYDYDSEYQGALC